ncbi:MAG: hypothetical protein U0353_17365 [Sandaracinus sp.]
MSDIREDVVTVIARYTNTARFGVRHCTPIAIELQKSAPPSLNDAQREALRLVGVRAREVEEIASARERTGPPSVRGPRRAVVVGWSGMQSALLAVATLPAGVVPQSADAARIAASLFPEGVTFGAGDAAAVWAHSQRLLGRIETEGLVTLLETLIHPGFLRAVRAAHAELGTATGLSSASAVSYSTGSLVEARSRFAFAVSRYARALSVDIDDRDHEAAARFAAALAPIDNYRITSDKPDEDELDADPTPIADPAAPTPSPGGPTPAPFG